MFFPVKFAVRWQSLPSKVKQNKAFFPMQHHPDEVATSTAARLLGISSSMFAKLVAGGHVKPHRRGYVSASAAVKGYAAFLRSSAQRSERNSAQARAHRARAAQIEAKTAKRLGAVIDAKTVLTAVHTILENGRQALDAVELEGVAPTTCAAFERVRGASMRKLQEAEAKIVADLRGGRHG
jgi:hypothetical protein